MRNSLGFIFLSVATLLLFHNQSFAMGKQPPKDLAFIQGVFDFISCTEDTIDTLAIPRRVQFHGTESGTAHIVLETRSSYLTTRVFSVLEGSKQKCLDDNDYSAKCRVKRIEDAVHMDVSWDCKTSFWNCTAETPKKYSFSLKDSNTLFYTHDESAKCYYRRN